MPRIGDEVLIDFIHGDLRRPIVVGSVYNGEDKPPVSLPTGQTITTIKSSSTKGGGGSNELRLIVGRNFNLAAGNGITIEAQKSISISAGDELTINCGQASIVLQKNGNISITGKEVSVKASGSIVLKGQKILEN